MLKKIFKWLYLLLSGMSFILILFLIAFFSYLYVAEDEVESFVNDFQNYRSYKKNEKLFEEIDVDQEVMMMAMNSKPFKNKPKSGSDPKIKIKTQDGYAYLRPSQILYIESGENYHTLTAINGRKIDLNKRATPLKNIGANLNDYLCFISLKSYIINCNYVEQVKRISQGNYSKTFLIMEDDYQIPIPDKSIPNIIKLLEPIDD